MIIQCEQCQTRFRLADEKLKPTGIKVRCSKCKHVFTVMPPEPEPPEEEAVDFDAMNMEAVDEPPARQPASAEGGQAPERETAAGDEGTPQSRSESAASEIDFSRLQEDMAAPSSGEDELADDFSFADSAPAEEPAGAALAADTTEEAGREAETSGDEPSSFDLGDFPAEEDAAQPAGEETEDFSLDLDENRIAAGPAPPAAPTEQGDFAFGDADEDAEEFQFDMPETASADLPEEEFGMGTEAAEFSFDEEPRLDEAPFGAEETDQWQEETAADEDSFDFDEPDFGAAADESETEGEAFAFGMPDRDSGQGAEEPSSGSLQFGEIDLQTDDDSAESHALETDTDFAGARFSGESTFEEESAAFAEEEQDQPKSQRARVEKPLAPPPAKRKGPLSKVLLLLFLLLLALGAAAGYFYLQDGSLDVNRILERFTGQAKTAPAEHKININITDTGYINNNHAGQLLVVQGQVVNNYPSARSAITVKGVLLNDQGKPLYQQTVFCGNPLNEATLRRAPYAKLEEAMNNQFGDSLSNMDVAPGASIPFTIVFRNLPGEIANINVEVVGSKPGSS